MKRIVNNDVMEIIECKTDKNDITNIVLVENAVIKDTKDDNKALKSTFLKITNRKGETRVLDLVNGIDITNMLKELEIINIKKTRETDMFIGK